MVDVGHKAVTARTAVAEAWVVLGEAAFSLVEANKLKKGDVLTVAQLAGICGSKHTSLLIPLCHPVPISHAKVSLELVRERFAVRITSQVSTTGQTGVEMEALTAATVAALTVYDMCKAVTHDMIITDVALVSKTGGQRGDYQRRT
jgi:molybdenum cofactor biosynthesis protein MoaC